MFPYTISYFPLHTVLLPKNINQWSDSRVYRRCLIIYCALIGQIGLVPSKSNNNILISLLTKFFDPCLSSFECIWWCYVVNYYCCLSTAEIYFSFYDNLWFHGFFQVRALPLKLTDNTLALSCGIFLDQLYPIFQIWRWYLLSKRSESKMLLQ